MTEHICVDGKWAEGSLASCQKHDKQGAKARNVRWGKAARRKMDREAGVVGKDVGGGILRG